MYVGEEQRREVGTDGRKHNNKSGNTRERREGATMPFNMHIVKDQEQLLMRKVILIARHKDPKGREATENEAKSSKTWKDATKMGTNSKVAGGRSPVAATSADINPMELGHKEAPAVKEGVAEMAMVETTGESKLPSGICRGASVGGAKAEAARSCGP